MHGSIKVTLGVLSLNLMTALRVWGPSCTRRVEPAHPQVSTVRDPWIHGRLRNDLRRGARPDHDAQAAVKRRYESEDGGNHGHLSDRLGLLWFVDCFATGDCMECGCSRDQFSERRRIRPFRAQGTEAKDGVDGFVDRCRRRALRVEVPDQVGRRFERGCASCASSRRKREPKIATVKTRGGWIGGGTSECPARIRSRRAIRTAASPS